MESNMIDKSFEEKLAIVDTIVTQVNSTDKKEFDLQREQFADDVLIDFGGVKPNQTIKAHDLMNWVKVAYKGLITMHISFNHQISVAHNDAHVYSYGRALHKTDEGADFWNIYAIYEHDLVKENGKWKIRRMKMSPIFSEGNPQIIDQNYEKNKVNLV